MTGEDVAVAVRADVRGRAWWLARAVGLFLLLSIVGMAISGWVESHGWLGTGAPDANGSGDAGWPAEVLSIVPGTVLFFGVPATIGLALILPLAGRLRGIWFRLLACGAVLLSVTSWYSMFASTLPLFLIITALQLLAVLIVPPPTRG